MKTETLGWSGIGSRDRFRPKGRLPIFPAFFRNQKIFRRKKNNSELKLKFCSSYLSNKIKVFVANVGYPLIQNRALFDFSGFFGAVSGFVASASNRHRIKSWTEEKKIEVHLLLALERLVRRFARSRSRSRSRASMWSAIPARTDAPNFFFSFALTQSFSFDRAARDAARDEGWRRFDALLDSCSNFMCLPNLFS